MSSNQSVKLYESLKRLPKAQFNEVCFYLREKYNYDLSYLSTNEAPAESARQLIELIKINSQGLVHLEKVINKDTTQNEPEYLLFYLFNREKQKEEIKKIIKSYHEQHLDKKQCPLLCFLYSEENEYGNFIDCIVNDFFSNDDDFFRYFRNNKPYSKELLLKKEFYTTKELHQEMLKFLKDWLFENHEEKDEEKDVLNKKDIANKLSIIPNPLVIYIYVRHYDWNKWQDKETIIESFVKFWKNWPETDEPKYSSFFVFIVFIDKPEKNTLLLKIKKIFNLSKIIQQPKLLKKGKLLGNNIVLLPKLDSIKERDVHIWANDYRKQIRRNGGNLGRNKSALTVKIEELYSKRETIPMKELAQKLEMLFNNSNN